MIDTYTKIACIVCSKELHNLNCNTRDGIPIEVHPMSGLHFSTSGHYGSGIFDPMGTRETLDVAICDKCVMENLDKVRGTGKAGLLDVDTDDLDL
jgi:hypothetical protein